MQNVCLCVMVIYNCKNIDKYKILCALSLETNYCQDFDALPCSHFYEYTIILVYYQNMLQTIKLGSL